MRKIDTNSNTYIGHMKMPHKAEYSVAALSKRLEELQPNFLVPVRTLTEKMDVERMQQNVPIVYFMNDNSGDTPMSFKILAMNKKDKAFFVDMQRGMDFDHPYSEIVKRPYILVEQKYLDENLRFQLFEKLDFSDSDAMEKALFEIFNIDIQVNIVYKFQSTYKNYEEIMEKEREAMKNKIPELDGEGLKQILDHEDSVSCVFVYTSVSQLEDKVYANLVQMNHPINSFVMNASLLKSHFPEDSEAINQIMSGDSGRYVFFPFGDAKTKKDRSLILDKFDTTYLVGG